MASSTEGHYNQIATVIVGTVSTQLGSIMDFSWLTGLRAGIYPKYFQIWSVGPATFTAGNIQTTLDGYNWATLTGTLFQQIGSGLPPVVTSFAAQSALKFRAVGAVASGSVATCYVSWGW